MSVDKQIEEMAKIIAKANGKIGYEDYFKPDAIDLYNAGYRKASDVAREIFEEIEENLNNLIRYYKEKRKYVTEVEYNELEQRYCDIKIRTFEERLLKIAKLKKKYTEKDNG